MLGVIAIWAYQTSDGQIWDSAEKAKKHQKNIELKINVTAWVSKYYFYDMSKEALTEAILEGWQELVDCHCSEGR